jgi:hypothetical protein
MPSRVSVVAGILFVVLAAPASAQVAPTIEPLKPCYVTAGTAAHPQGEGVGVSAQGFTANSRVDLTVNGQPLEGGSSNLQVDANGVLPPLKPFPAPFVRSGSQDFTVTLAEQNNPANTVTATAKSTRLGVKIRPTSARPSQRISFKGRGFTAEKPVYAHYTRGGRQIERVRMARRTGECGTWSVRRPQFPMKDPDQGTWFVQFDQSKQYKDGTRGTLESVYVRVKIKVSLVRG